MKAKKYISRSKPHFSTPLRWGGALLIVVCVAGFWMPRDDIFFAIKKNMTIFGALYEELSVGYVDEVDPERMMRAGIEAMLGTLDPYTVFIDEADNEEIDIMTQGRYAGVGLSVTTHEDGRIVVAAPIEGYSGFKQGVRAGDVITHINNESVRGLSSDDVGTLLRGDPGTTVDLRIEREGEPEAIEFVLTRSEVKIKNVTYADFVDADTLQGIGYVRLERFARDAAGEVRHAIQSMQKEAPLKGFILDLRDNPGGLLDAAVDISGMFVEQGAAIVSTRGRLAQTERVYRNRRPPLLPEVPVVILVNQSSASASEIVAGALQDLDRGVVLGDRSFGKGLVQIVRPLPYNTSLKMTTSKYYTPSGRSIQSITYTHRIEDGYAVEVADSLRNAFETAGGRMVRDGGGIEPDVESPRPEMSELEAALLRKSAFFLFANQYAAGRAGIDESFTITEEVMAAFRQWLADEQFSYRTHAERMIDALASDLKETEYSGTSDEIEALRQEIVREKEKDYERHADVLKERLRAEILARYFGETAQIKASLAHDTQVLDAVTLLNDRTRYEAVLNGSE